MNQPLGRAIGNALEVKEAVALLNPAPASAADRNLRENCLALAGEGFVLAGTSPNAAAGRALAALLLSGGDAYAKFREIVAAQGGNLSYIDVPEKLPTAPVLREVESTDFGTIRAIDAAALGNAVIALGGGRARKEDTVNPAVGLVVHRKIGDSVSFGDALATIHAQTDADADAAVANITTAFQIA